MSNESWDHKFTKLHIWNAFVQMRKLWLDAGLFSFVDVGVEYRIPAKEGRAVRVDVMIETDKGFLAAIEIEHSAPATREKREVLRSLGIPCYEVQSKPTKEEQQAVAAELASRAEFTLEALRARYGK